MNSSHSELSRAVLTSFTAPILAENEHAGKADHRLSLLANVKNLDKNYTTVKNWTFIPNQLPNIVANIPIQLCVGGFWVELMFGGDICIIVVHFGGGSIVNNLDTYVDYT